MHQSTKKRPPGALECGAWMGGAVLTLFLCRKAGDKALLVVWTLPDAQQWPTEVRGGLGPLECARVACVQLPWVCCTRSVGTTGIAQLLSCVCDIGAESKWLFLRSVFRSQ